MIINGFEVIASAHCPNTRGPFSIKWQQKNRPKWFFKTRFKHIKKHPVAYGYNNKIIVGFRTYAQLFEAYNK